MHVDVSYFNATTRPLILPAERRMTVYYGLKPEAMSAYEDNLGVFEPTVKAMKELPPSVSLDNPVDPSNDVFKLIPVGGQMTTPRGQLTLPVNRYGFFKRDPDLRGHRVYIKLRFVQQEMAPALMQELSTRWLRFGNLWTGAVTTNTFVVDVPAAPAVKPKCADDESEQSTSSPDDHIHSGK